MKLAWRYSIIYVWHDSVKCVTWLIDMCAVPHPSATVSVSTGIYSAKKGWERDMNRLFVPHNVLISRMWMIEICVALLNHICVTWLSQTCDMTHWHVCRDTATCVTLLYDICDVTHSYVWRDAFIYVTWLIHLRDVTHSHLWCDSFVCVTWLTHICDMTHSYLWHDSIDVCAVTHSLAWRCSIIYVTWLIHMCDMTQKTCVPW